MRMMRMSAVAAVGLAVMCLAGPARSGMQAIETTAEEREMDDPGQGEARTLKTATIGGGCFWCVEAVFQELKGVEKVVSGYAGGHVPNPSYKAVCTGMTGHAEVAQITYDPAVISYPEILEVFWKTHDPTTLNRQGNDVGTQYRSIILTHDEEQDKLAKMYKKKLNESGAFNRPVVTEIKPLEAFYAAEDYHQNYYRSNPYQGYCQYVIVPKLDKFRKVFRDKLKVTGSQSR
jgi:peptide-methionine (S)-S-oxide reductase